MVRTDSRDQSENNELLSLVLMKPVDSFRQTKKSLVKTNTVQIMTEETRQSIQLQNKTPRGISN